MCHKCRKTKASKSTLYVRYKRLLNPRVTVRPPQTCCWQVSLKNESAARPGEVLSQLKQYHKQPLFFRCYWAQVVFHWITSSNTDYITFFQINKQDFKQRHKTKTWICNSANQALLNKKKNLWWKYNERLPLFEMSKSCGCRWRLQHSELQGWWKYSPSTAAQLGHCNLHPDTQRGSDLCNCFLVM